MVLFYLTNASLDIALGVGWWVFKNTASGIYYTGKYIIYGSEEPIKKENDINELLMIEMKQLKDELKSIKEKI
jgi:hypothetical protein